MKLLTTLLLCTTMCYAQFNSDAPWANNLPQKAPGENYSFTTIQEAFNAYWANKDPNKKASGYKPFKRWEYQWENEVNPNGHLPTALETWQSFEEKNNSYHRSALADESNWSPLGPFTHINTGSWSSGQARVNVVLIDPNNSAVWYVGTPAGGLWKSTNSGSTWTPLTDNLPQIGVSGIAIHPSNSQIIYIATGDDDAANTDSVGVFKSTDGGQTWSQTGLNPSNTPSSMNDIYVHPNDANTLWVATNDGVYKTTNAGVNWTQSLPGWDIKDIKLKPGNPNTIYAVTKQRFYRSTDGGGTYNLITNGLPTTSGRFVIDVTPANPEYIYLISSNTNSTYQGIYRSTDGGTSFIARNTFTNVFEGTQAWYDLALAVSDTDPELIFTGCLNVWKSTNGGAAISKINSWSNPNGPRYTHADIHFLRYYNGHLYCGSDGGVYASTNDGTSFSDYTAGIQASQFYKIAVAKNNPNRMVGGLQDNGGHAYDNGNGQWRNYYGADGMDTAIDPNNDSRYFGFIQNGGNLYISNTAGNSSSSTVAKPNGSTGNWVTPLAANNTSEVYAGYEKLYRLNNTLDGWVELANLSNSADLIEIAPSNEDIMYVVVDRVVKKSTDRGATFTDVHTAPSNIKGIAIHNTDPNTLWITTSGAGRGVFKSINGGSTFTNITGNLPTSQYYNDIVHQARHSQNPIYIGTSLGVYRLDDTAANWEPFFNNLPNTIVNDLEININDETITAATYGRGIWRSAIPVELIATDVRLVSIKDPNSTLINCGSITPEIEVKNNGQNAITAIDITSTLDGAPTVFNWTGNLASGATTTITLPTFNTARGTHNLEINTTISGDGNGDNNTSQLTFIANDNGVVNVVNTFEAATDAIINYNETPGSIWERGVPNDALLNAASSGTSAYATDLDADYPNNTKSYLITQCYDLTQLANPVLRFDMAFDLEENWDILYIEYSTDGGQNWDILGRNTSTPNWYNSDRTNTSSGGSDCYNCPGAQWTGTDGTIKEYAYDFAANAGTGETDLTSATNIVFRFVFHSDHNTTKEGVVIDDLVIDGTPLSVENESISAFSLYPNPAQDQLIIKPYQNNKINQVEIFDTLGKRVQLNTSFDHGQEQYRLNINMLADGLYLIKISIDGKTVTKKFIKQSQK